MLYNPVDTQGRFNVYETSIRRRRRHRDVLKTLKRRRVSTGKITIFKNSVTLKGKHLRWNLFLIKLQVLRVSNKGVLL